ncbi:putative F-box only protein 9 [Triticum urartu]|uniref:F-box domain-containing protein n=1 Tax=Triticum urartu TaxID=4572 RepID=A0A8R7TB36_TRIUA|nr:putative F-box only protein 9 [Triticum urartu]
MMDPSGLFPASSSQLPDDLLIEIFLCLPAHPTCLIRTSLVCKRWHCLIKNRQFVSRFRTLHQKLPVLCFFSNSTSIPRFIPTGDPPNCVSTAAFSLPDPCWQVLGCRHSLVLLVSSTWTQLQVWNPMTGSRQYVPATPDADRRFNHGIVPESQATVLCAAGHKDSGDCHSCPFLVVWVFTCTRYAYACRYSSESSSWHQMVSKPTPSDIDSRPSVLVGDILYWPLKAKYILAFELDTRKLYHIECPEDTLSVYRRNVHIMKAEDGGLGLAALTEFNLRLWARETGPEGVMEWVLRRTIQLDAFLPPNVSSVPLVNNHSASGRPVRILGLIEDDDMFFMWTREGVFAVELKSMRCNKVFEAQVPATIFPYIGFYTTGDVDGAP